MMLSEFIERTNYEPSSEEYHFIEESYYDFKGDKDDFCKQWLKEKAAGVWDREYEIRKRAEKEISDYKRAYAATNSFLEWYKNRANTLSDEADALKGRCNELETEIAEMTGEVEASDALFHDACEMAKKMKGERDKYYARYIEQKAKADKLERELDTIEDRLYDVLCDMGANKVLQNEAVANKFVNRMYGVLYDMIIGSEEEKQK